MSAGSKKPTPHLNPWWYGTSIAPMPKQQKAVFRSNVPGLCDDVFDMAGGPQQAHQYHKTLNALCTHIGNNFKGGQRLVNSIKKGTSADDEIPRPKKGDTGDKDFDDENFKLAMKAYRAKIKEFEENTQLLWSLVFGQCSPRMATKLKSLPAYKEAKPLGDGRVLLQIIRALMHDFDSENDLGISVQIAFHQYFAYAQTPHQSLQDYYDGFTGIVDTLAFNGFSFAVKEASGDDTALQDRIHAAGFLLKADRSRYGGVVTHLANRMALGINEYPKTLLAAFYLLSKWQDDSRLQY